MAGQSETLIACLAAITCHFFKHGSTRIERKVKLVVVAHRNGPGMRGGAAIHGGVSTLCGVPWHRRGAALRDDFPVGVYLAPGHRGLTAGVRLPNLSACVGCPGTEHAAGLHRGEPRARRHQRSELVQQCHQQEVKFPDSVIGEVLLQRPSCISGGTIQSSQQVRLCQT